MKFLPKVEPLGRAGPRTLRSVLQQNPELGKLPIYNSQRFPRAFEENLLMAIRENHLIPHRFNLEDQFTIDGVIQTTKGSPLFYYDVEFSRSNLFDEEGRFRFWTVHIPIEKLRIFKRFKPAVYVRGNLEHVLVLRGDSILAGEPITIPAKHGIEPKIVIADRDFIEVNTRSALAKNHLKIVPLKRWLHAVKEMFALDLFLVGS